MERHKGHQKIPEHFRTLKANFLEKVQIVCREHNTLQSLVLNMEETGLPIIPVSSWTLAAKGSNQVPVVGLEDKRQMTAALACSATGKLLSPQLLDRGTTERCHHKDGELECLARPKPLVNREEGEEVYCHRFATVCGQIQGRKPTTGQPESTPYSGRVCVTPDRGGPRSAQVCWVVLLFIPTN